LLVNYLMT